MSQEVLPVCRKLNSAWTQDCGWTQVSCARQAPRLPPQLLCARVVTVLQRVSFIHSWLNSLVPGVSPPR